MALAGGVLKDWIGLGAALQISAMMLMAAGVWLLTLDLSTRQESQVTA